MTTSALILAAGRGSRMGSATANRPKCLVPLAGKSMLEWQQMALRAGGISNITVARGYKKEMLQGDFDTVDNPHWSKSNMVTTLLYAFSRKMPESSVVAYSDIVYHPNHVKLLRDSTEDITILYDVNWRSLWDTRFEYPLDDAESFLEYNGWLQDIGHRVKTYDRIQGQFMGLLHFTKRGFTVLQEHLAMLPQGEIDKLDVTALLQRLLNSNVQIHTIPVKGGWCEVDSLMDIKHYERKIEEFSKGNKRWLHDWREYGK